jgi:hypothetical protein
MILRALRPYILLHPLDHSLRRSQRLLHASTQVSHQPRVPLLLALEILILTIPLPVSLA